MGSKYIGRAGSDIGGRFDGVALRCKGTLLATTALAFVAAHASAADVEEHACNASQFLKLSGHNGVDDDGQYLQPVRRG